MSPSDVRPELLEATELIRTKMNKTVLEIAQENAEEYKWEDDFPDCPAIITLLDVALSAQQRWEVVFSSLEGFAQEFPTCTLASLPDVVKSEGKRKFIERWFFEDLTRYLAVERLASRFIQYQERWVLDTEYEAMQHWAGKYLSSEGWPDPNDNELLKGIQGLDIVSVQYLLQRLGQKTVKPDNRLRLVFTNLEIPFENEIDLIQKGHLLAEHLGLDPLTFDLMFW